MRRVLMLLSLAAILPVTAAAELPLTGLINVYADGAHQYNAYCAFPPGNPIAKIEMWIWCLPSTHGLKCAEFSIGYPANALRDRITTSPAISSSQGDLANGYSACFGVCQLDWVWIAHQTLYVTSNAQTFVEILPHPTVGLYRFFNCDSPGCCNEPAIKGTTLYISNNAYPCLPPEIAIGTEPDTWGAVKSLYQE
jgi:hypothetical protein